jgi:hypothetical protein
VCEVLGSRREGREVRELWEVRKVREGWYCLGAVQYMYKVYKLTKSRVVGIVIVKKNPCAHTKVPTVPTSAAVVGGGSPLYPSSHLTFLYRENIMSLFVNDS